MATTEPAFSLILMNIDGSEGQSFDIHGDVLIGRDKGCNVRIKLPSISRQHAKMSFDENGQIILTHLSKTNPSFINGNRLTDTTALSHGDLLAFGDRIFMFKQLNHETGTNELTIDRNATKLDIQSSYLFSPPKKSMNILSEQNRKPSSTSSPVNVAVPVAKKGGLPTPLRKTIEARRKSGVANPASEVVVSLAKSPAAVIKKESNRLALPTPLRKSIISRRQSLDNQKEPAAATAPLLEMVDKLNKTPSKKPSIERRLPTPLRQGITALKRRGGEDSPPAAAPTATRPKSALKKRRESGEALAQAIPVKQVNFNLQEAIVARKKTLRRVGASDETTTSTATTSSTISTEPEPTSNKATHSLVPTDLRLAVARRRQIIDQQEAAMAALTSQPPAATASTATAIGSSKSPERPPIKKRLFTPLRQDIAKRRRMSAQPETLDDFIDGLEVKEREEEPRAASSSTSTSQQFLSPVVEKVVAAMAETLASPDHTNHRLSVSQTVSGSSPVVKEKMATVQPVPVKGLATPLRKAIQAKRKSFAASTATEKKKPAVVEEVVEERQVVKGLATPLRRAIEAKRKSFAVPPPPPAVSEPEINETEAEVKAMEVIPNTSQSEPVHTEAQEEPEEQGEVKEVFEEGEVVVESYDATETLVKDIITSQSLQITTDIVCQELSTQMTPGKTTTTLNEISETIAEVLLSPQLASPVATASAMTTPATTRRRSSLPKRDNSKLFSPVSPNNDRRTQHLIQSIEKKSQLRYSEVLQTVSDRESYLTDLVAHLSDLDMEVIESYAQKLVATASRLVMDADDAFGVALDAYIRGIEIASQQLASQTNSDVMKGAETVVEEDLDADASREEVDAVLDAVGEDDLTEDEEEAEEPPSAERPEEDEAENDEYCYDYSEVLQQLFRLPRDYLDANSDALDAELVELYAEELTATAGVSSAVAYGIALDSYSSDPVQFRHFVGRLALPALEKIHYLETEEAVEEKKEVVVEESQVPKTPAPVTSTAKRSVKKSTAKKMTATPALEPVVVETEMEVVVAEKEEQVMAVEGDFVTAEQDETVGEESQIPKTPAPASVKKSVRKSTAKKSLALAATPAPESVVVMETEEVEMKVVETNPAEEEEVGVESLVPKTPAVSSAIPAATTSAKKSVKKSTAKKSLSFAATPAPESVVVLETQKEVEMVEPLQQTTAATPLETTKSTTKKSTTTARKTVSVVLPPASPIAAPVVEEAKEEAVAMAEVEEVVAAQIATTPSIKPPRSATKSSVKNTPEVTSAQKSARTSTAQKSGSEETVEDEDRPVEDRFISSTEEVKEAVVKSTGKKNKRSVSEILPTTHLTTTTTSTTPVVSEVKRPRRSSAAKATMTPLATATTNDTSVDGVYFVPDEEEVAVKEATETTRLSEVVISESTNDRKLSSASSVVEIPIGSLPSEETEEVVEEEQKKAVKTPVKPAGKGRKRKAVEEEEPQPIVSAVTEVVTQEVVEEASVQSSKRRKGVSKAKADTVKEEVTLVPQPEAMEVVQEEEEQQKEEVVAVPVRKGRGGKASTKTTTPSTTPVVETPAPVPEEEEIKAEGKEVVVETAPPVTKKTTTGRGAKKAAATTAKTEETVTAIADEPEQQEEVVVVEEKKAPAAKKTTRAGAKKVASVSEEVVVEVTPAPVEVPEPEEEKEEVVPAKKTAVRGGRGKKAAVVEEEEEVDEPVPVVAQKEEVKKVTKGRGKKTTTAAAEEIVVVVEEIPATKEVEEAPAKKGKGPAKGKKATAETVVVEEVTPVVKEVEEVKKPTAARGGRGKKAEEEIVVEKEEVKEETKKSTGKGRQTKTTAAKKVVEEEDEEEEEEIALAILCDGCDEEYFVDEVGLKKIPKGKWFCSKCTAKPAAATTTAKATATRKKK